MSNFQLPRLGSKSKLPASARLGGSCACSFLNRCMAMCVWTGAGAAPEWIAVDSNSHSNAFEFADWSAAVRLAAAGCQRLGSARLIRLSQLTRSADHSLTHLNEPIRIHPPPPNPSWTLEAYGWAQGGEGSKRVTAERNRHREVEGCSAGCSLRAAAASCPSLPPSCACACLHVQGTTLPRTTEPRESDAAMTASSMREKETGAGGAAAAAGVGVAARGASNQTITELVIRDHNHVKKLYEGKTEWAKEGQGSWHCSRVCLADRVAERATERIG